MTEDEFAARLEDELATIQEDFLADAHAKGFDGTETHLYRLIVALRRFATRDES